MSKRKYAENEIHAPNKKQRNDENTIVFVMIPSLERMAAMSTAISLWYHHPIQDLSKEHQNYLDEDTDDSESYGDFLVNDNNTIEGSYFSEVLLLMLNAIDKLPVPRSIGKKISQYLYPIREQISKWISYHKTSVFSEYERNISVYRHVDDIVWKSTGKIDYLGTAKSLLSSPRVTDVEKFRLISLYCMEEELPRMNPAVFYDKYLTNVSLSANPLVYYWLCYATGTMYKFDDKLGNFDSIECLMISFELVHNIHAIRYFWDNLREEAKVDITVMLLRRRSMKYMCPLISQLNEFQQKQVFMQMGADVLLYLLENRVWNDYFIRTWVHIKDIVTKNDFYDVLVNLTIPSNLWFLMEYWKHAPSHLKQFALECEDRRFTNGMLTYFGFKECVQLFPVVLCDANIKLRKEILHSEKGRSLCFRAMKEANFALLDIFVTLCLSLREDVFKHKLNILLSDEGKRLQEVLIKSSQFTSLKTFISQCFPGNEEAAKYKKELLYSNSGKQLNTYFLKRYDYAALNLFWSFCLDDEELVENYKKHILTTKIVEEYCGSLVVHHKIETLNKFLAMCSNDENEILDFKHKVLLTNWFQKVCDQFIANNNFVSISKLVIECLMDSVAVAKFNKKFLYSDKIMNICARMMYISDYKSIHNLINLFLSDEEEKKKYKSAVVFSSHGLTERLGTLTYNWSEKLKLMVSEMLTAQEDVDTLKSIVLDSIKYEELHKFFNYFNDVQWRDFLSWLFKTRQEVYEFKRSIPFDKIFSVMLKAAVFRQYNDLLRSCKFQRSVSFRTLNYFLKWYFVTDNAMKEFKIRRIFNATKIDVINTLLRKKDSEPLATVLKWFFDGNQQQIEKFRLVFKTSRLGSLI